jgi:hypothetical protein
MRPDFRLLRFTPSYHASLLSDNPGFAAHSKFIQGRK